MRCLTAFFGYVGFVRSSNHVLKPFQGRAHKSQYVSQSTVPHSNVLVTLPLIQIGPVCGHRHLPVSPSGAETQRVDIRVYHVRSCPVLGMINGVLKCHA